MRKIQSITAVLLVILVLAACGSKTDENTPTTGDVSFDEVYASIEDAMLEGLIQEDDSLTKDELLSNYIIEDLTQSVADNPSVEFLFEKMGIEQDSIANGTALFAMMNLNADEVILLEAKTDEDVELLKAGLEKELATQIQMWEQYLPDQYEKVKQNVIKTNGKFLIYVTASNPEEIGQAFDKHFK